MPPRGSPRIDAPAVASRENDSDTDLPLPSSRFEGDVAIKELRRRLSSIRTLSRSRRNGQDGSLSSRGSARCHSCLSWRRSLPSAPP